MKRIFKMTNLYHLILMIKQGVHLKSIILQLFLQICGALAIHKIVIGISLGVRLVQSNMRPKTVVICCIVFSAQILIGGFIGLGIVDVLNKESHGIAGFVSGILQVCFSSILKNFKLNFRHLRLEPSFTLHVLKSYLMN